MDTTTLDSSVGWPPLPSGPPPVPPPSTSVLPSRSFPLAPTGSFSGTPPPPGDYDTPPPPGDSSKSNSSSDQTGLAAWENAQKALAALNSSPKPNASNSNHEEHNNSWQGYPPAGWGPPIPHGPMGRFPAYGYPPRPPYGFPPMPPRMPPWGRPPMRSPHMGGPNRPPMWGPARQPLSTSNATSTATPTTSSGQPIRFNLQFQKQQKAMATPPPPPPSTPQSIPLPGQAGQSLSLSDASKNPTPGSVSNIYVISILDTSTAVASNL